MMVFKRNQIVILSLILVILVAGYLQYTYKRGSSTASKDNGRLGEAVYVDNQKLTDSDVETAAKADESVAAKTGNETSKAADTAKSAEVKKDANTNKTDDKSKKDDKTKSSDNDKSAVSTTKNASDYFAQAKLDKDLSRSKSTDALKAISEDENATKETRAAADTQRIKLIQNAEKEMRIETLIKDKNYEDAVVVFADDGSMDIVVKTPELTDAQATQIADIAARQAKVEISAIHVRNYY